MHNQDMYCFGSGNGPVADPTAKAPRDFEFTFCHYRTLFTRGALKHSLPSVEDLRFSSLPIPQSHKLVTLKYNAWRARNQAAYHKPDQVTLLSLPPELRLQIYKDVLINHLPGNPSPFPINIMPPSSPIQRENLQQPALAAVDRQLRSEVLPFFYQQNRFILSAADGYEKRHRRLALQSNTFFLTWLRAIGQRNCELLKDVCVHMPEKSHKWRQASVFCQELELNGIKGIDESAVHLWG